MSIKKEKTITVFDENWAPIGTIVHIEGYEGSEVESTIRSTSIVGVVKSYTYDGDAMNIRTINGIDTRITIDKLDKLYIRRMVPEDANTVDMDYKSLVNSHYGGE